MFFFLIVEIIIYKEQREPRLLLFQTQSEEKAADRDKLTMWILIMIFCDNRDHTNIIVVL